MGSSAADRPHDVFTSFCAVEAHGASPIVVPYAHLLFNGAFPRHAGDLVLKGDVVQTGQGSTLALTFLDGTAFNLSSNARMVLNELVYSEGGTDNQALLSLVQGSISFLAGQIAKSGDMRVDTPVTT